MFINIQKNKITCINIILTPVIFLKCK